MLLRHIRYFLAVAEHRNFTRAAEALHVSQPTLSQQIRQLEDTLRVQLLDRSGRSIQLTDAGAAYVRYAQRALQDLEAGKRAIHDVRRHEAPHRGVVIGKLALGDADIGPVDALGMGEAHGAGTHVLGPDPRTGCRS